MSKWLDEPQRDIAACLLNQSSRAATKHVVVHIGTNDCSRDSNYNKQLVMFSFKALAKQLVRVFPKAAVAFTSILPKRSGHTCATEEANKMLKEMSSSCGFELLHHSLLRDSSRTFQKQLYSDEVHLNQRGLATLLTSIIAFLSRSWGGCSPIPKERQRHSVRENARLYSVVARGRGSASLPVSQNMPQRQYSQRKTDPAPQLQDRRENQQPQLRDGLGHGADPHHTHSSSGSTLAVHPCRRHCLLSPSRLPGTLLPTTPGLHTFPSSVCCRHPPTIHDDLSVFADTPQLSMMILACLQTPTIDNDLSVFADTLQLSTMVLVCLQTPSNYPR